MPVLTSAADKRISISMRRALVWILMVSSLSTPWRTLAQSRQTTVTGSQTAAGRVSDAKVLPGTQANAFSTIRGTALDANNLPLANTVVRLRDVRSGRLVGTVMTDKLGAFTFRGVDPGSYIVEVMAVDKTTTLAASGVINVNAGDAVTTIVQLPFKAPPLSGALGRTAGAALLVTAAAATSGVLATQIAGEQKSPRQ